MVTVVRRLCTCCAQAIEEAEGAQKKLRRYFQFSSAMLAPPTVASAPWKAVEVWQRQRRRPTLVNRDESRMAAGRCTEAPDVTTTAAAAAAPTGKLSPVAATPISAPVSSNPSHVRGDVSPESAKQDTATATVTATATATATATTANKNQSAAGRDPEGEEREADTPTGRQGEAKVKAKAKMPSAAAATSNEPPNSPGDVLRARATATARATAMKLPPGVETATGGVDEAKISFGDLGNGFSSSGSGGGAGGAGGDGGGGGDGPAVWPRVSESVAAQGYSGGGQDGRTLRRRRRQRGAGGGDADGEADVLEMLKYLPKLFLKGALARR